MPTISSERLRKICTTVLKAAGAPDEIAEQVTDCLVSANLLGVDSHGVFLLPTYLERIKKGWIIPTNKPKVINETPTTAIVDGNHQFGYVVAPKAMEIAIKKAKENGIAVVTIRKVDHIGRLGYYAMMAAKENMIGFIACDADPLVAPYGGVDKILGTNPFAIAIPGKEYPFLLDIATSMRAGGWIKQKLLAGEKLPPGWMINEKGEVVLDASEYASGAARLVTFGGYKGYGISVAVSLLTGCLADIGCGLFIDQTRKRYWNSSLIIVIDIAKFAPIEEFKEKADFLFKGIKNSKKAPGVEEILIPGEPEWRTQRIRSREGIPFSDGHWNFFVSGVKEQIGTDVEKIE